MAVLISGRPALLAVTLFCLPAPEMAQRLAECCGEVQSATGVAAGGTLLTELWRNPKNRSWTLTVMTPGGPRCVLVTGFDWQDVTAPPHGEQL